MSGSHISPTSIVGDYSGKKSFVKFLLSRLLILKKFSTVFSRPLLNNALYLHSLDHIGQKKPAYNMRIVFDKSHFLFFFDRSKTIRTSLRLVRYTCLHRSSSKTILLLVSPYLPKDIQNWELIIKSLRNYKRLFLSYLTPSFS